MKHGNIHNFFACKKNQRKRIISLIIIVNLLLLSSGTAHAASLPAAVIQNGVNGASIFSEKMTSVFTPLKDVSVNVWTKAGESIYNIGEGTINLASQGAGVIGSIGEFTHGFFCGAAGLIGLNPCEEDNVVVEVQPQPFKPEDPVEEEVIVERRKRGEVAGEESVPTEVTSNNVTPQTTQIITYGITQAQLEQRLAEFKASLNIPEPVVIKKYSGGGYDNRYDRVIEESVSGTTSDFSGVSLTLSGNSDISGTANFDGEITLSGVSGTSGQVLTSAGVGAAPTWQNVAAGGASQLSALSDVNTSTPTNRNVLVADGVDWESRALTEADISDLGSYVPYTGATSNVDLGTYNFTTSGTIKGDTLSIDTIEANSGSTITMSDLYTFEEAVEFEDTINIQSFSLSSTFPAFNSVAQGTSNNNVMVTRGYVDDAGDSLVPYTGATSNVDLGTYNFTAADGYFSGDFEVDGFADFYDDVYLDGALDFSGNNFVSVSTGTADNGIMVTKGYVDDAGDSLVPYTGATSDLNLGANDVIAANYYFTSQDNYIDEIIGGGGDGDGVIFYLDDDDESSEFSINGATGDITWSGPNANLVITDTGSITNTSGSISFGDENVSTTGTITASGGNSTNWNTAYTHSTDNTQAHSDYLINNGDDTTSGTITAAGFTTAGDVIAANYYFTSQDNYIDEIIGGGGDGDGVIFYLDDDDESSEFSINGATGDITWSGPNANLVITDTGSITNTSGSISFGDENVSTTGTITASGGNSTNWNTAYTHSTDNTQAHSDYLINNGDDTTSGTITAAGFTTAGDVIAANYYFTSQDNYIDEIIGGGGDGDGVIFYLDDDDESSEFSINGATGDITWSGPNANLVITDTGSITNTSGSISFGDENVSTTGTITGSNLSGTNTGDQTSISGITGTKAQFNTALTDGTFAYSGGAFHDGFSDFVANEHIDWTSTSSNLSTTGTVQAEQLTSTDQASIANELAVGATSGKVIIGDITGNARGLYSVDIQSSNISRVDTQVASGSSSTAIGVNNTASGSYSTAIGYQNSATESGNYGETTAMGWGNSASGDYSVAIGHENRAEGEDSSAVGVSNRALGGQSSAFGYENTETDTSTGSLSNNALFGYSNDVTISNTASVTGSTFVGVDNDLSAAIGTYQYITAVGYSNAATGTQSTAVGYDNTASGSNSVALGYNNATSGGSSVSVGLNNASSSAYTFNSLFGYQNTADLDAEEATAIGYKNTVSSYKATAVGWQNSVSGEYSAAFGKDLTNSTDSTVMIGTGTAYLSINSVGQYAFNGLGTGDLQVAAGVLTVSSDTRLKNLEGSFDDGLEQLMGLEPITYTWKNNKMNTPGEVYAGFSAQNVQDNIPSAISTDSKGYLTLSERPILAASVNAIKELHTSLEQSKKQNTDLFAGVELDIEKLTNDVENNQSMMESVIDTIGNVSKYFKDEIFDIAQIVVNKITAQRVETQELCIGDTCVNEAQLIELLGDSTTEPVEEGGSVTEPSTTEEEPASTGTETPTEVTEPDTEQAVPEEGAASGGTETPTPAEEVIEETPVEPVVEETVPSDTETPTPAEEVIETPTEEPAPAEETPVEEVTPEPEPEPEPAPEAPVEEPVVE